MASPTVSVYSSTEDTDHVRHFLESVKRGQVAFWPSNSDVADQGCSPPVSLLYRTAFDAIQLEKACVIDGVRLRFIKLALYKLAQKHDHTAQTIACLFAHLNLGIDVARLIGRCLNVGGKYEKISDSLGGPSCLFFLHGSDYYWLRSPMPSLNETIRELEKTKLREQSACWKDVADAALREKMSDIRADSQFSPTPRFRTYGDTRRASSQKRPSNRKRARKSAKPSALDLRYANGIQTVSQQCDAIATVILPTRRTTIEHVHSSQHRLEDTAHYSHSEGRQISAVPELQGTSRLDNGVQHWSSEPNLSLFGVEGLEEFFGPFIFMGMNLSIKRSKDSTSFLTEAAQLWLPSEPYLNAKLGIWVQDSYGGCIEALLNSPSYSKEDLRFLLGDFLFGSTRAGIDEKALAVTILNDSNGDRKLEIILGFQDAVRLWQTDKGAELPS